MKKILIYSIFLFSCTENVKNNQVKKEIHVQKLNKVFLGHQNINIDGNKCQILLSPDGRDTLHTIIHNEFDSLLLNEGRFYSIFMDCKTIDNKLKMEVNSINIPRLTKNLIILIKDEITDTVIHHDNYLLEKGIEKLSVNLHELKETNIIETFILYKNQINDSIYFYSQSPNIKFHKWKLNGNLFYKVEAKNYLDNLSAKIYIKENNCIEN